MIHQHIFASPKPGLSEEEFHRYWINVHARDYASKIKQIRRYMICTRVACEGVTNPPIWNGCAEDVRNRFPRVEPAGRQGSATAVSKRGTREVADEWFDC